MATAAGTARTPYLVTVGPRLCRCVLPATDLGRRRTLDRAVSLVEGYWNVYLAFFGDQQVWLDWLITDLRDGRIIWRNGRRLPLEEEHDGTSTTESSR